MSAKKILGIILSVLFVAAFITVLSIAYGFLVTVAAIGIAAIISGIVSLCIWLLE